MDEQVYILNNQAYTILQHVPLSDATHDVQIEIYNVTDSATDTAFAAMTFVRNGTWSYSFTPSDTDVYLATIRNNTTTTDYFKYLNSTGTIAGSPAGSTEGDNLSTLRKEFLLYIDNYNADDLTGDGSSGDQARRCLNLAAQRIYSIAKDTKFLDSNPGSLSSVADQDYIELSGISDIDEIIAMTDGTNDIKLRKIPFWKYRHDIPDPSEVTGTPTHYTRLFNRIYLSPRPSAVITYTVDYKKNIGDMSADGDQVGIPSKFNYWLFSEAHVFWQIMEDKTDQVSIANLKSHAVDQREEAMADIRQATDEIITSDSHFGDTEISSYIYQRPVG